MNRILSFLSLPAIVSLSCNLGTGLVRGPALVDATGPILGMTVAASLDDQGQPVDPSFTYPFDQPEIVVLVRIGEVDAGPLTFSWYQVTEAGDEALFEQTVPVEAWDAAFSTGLNPGILAAGTYRVVATFAGQLEAIAWDVAEPQPGDLTDPVGTSQSAEGASPIPGPSGTATVPVPEPNPYQISGAVLFPHIYSDPPQVELEILSHNVTTPPVAVTIQYEVAITGSPPGTSREYTQAAGPGIARMYDGVDPCSLPGGSDLPGTSITVSAVPLGYESSRQTVTYVLGDDTSRPTVKIDPPLDPGKKVSQGDQIVLEVTAEELESEGSWQTGLFSMSLTGPEGLVDDWTDPWGAAQACTLKTWTRQETFTYTVPPNPPATIELCVVVQDYADNTNREACRTYSTGDQLIGTLTSTLTTSLLGGQNIGTDIAQGEAELSLTLQAEGKLTGTVAYTFTQHGEGTHSCGAYSQSSVPLQVTLPVDGDWTKDTIDFRFTTDAPIMVETSTTCAGETRTEQHDLTNMFVGRDWHADWDGQAYTASDRISSSGADWNSQSDWTIHLEPQEPVSD